MPTYEFRCPDGHEFEKLYRTISGAESQTSCPACGKPAERFMSAAGFAFKGSGFYLTDYGKNAHRDKGTPEVKTGDSSGGDSGGDSSSKSESAPSEAKSDTPKSDGAKGSDASSAGGDATKTEKKAEPKAESKPAPAPPKPGKSE